MNDGEMFEKLLKDKGEKFQCIIDSKASNLFQ